MSKWIITCLVVLLAYLGLRGMPPSLARTVTAISDRTVAWETQRGNRIPAWATPSVRAAQIAELLIALSRAIYKLDRITVHTEANQLEVTIITWDNERYTLYADGNGYVHALR